MDRSTADEIRAILEYDPQSGKFRWVARRGSAKIGDPAGCLATRGALVIRVNGKLHYAHRLAWLYVYGRWPDGEIDHINGDPTDNRIANLRDCTREENTRNVRRHKDTASGLKGAYLDRRRGTWYSRIYVDGRNINLGTFGSPEEAAAAYDAAAVKYHLNFAKTNST